MTVSERFLNMGEPLLAGLYENTDRGLFYRKALGLRRYYEAMPAPAYQPGRLYPSGARPSCGLPLLSTPPICSINTVRCSRTMTFSRCFGVRSG